jgi:hypothetical protein
MSILESIPRDWLERLKNNEFSEEDLEEFQEVFKALDEARFCLGDQIKEIVKQRQMTLMDWSKRSQYGEREGDFPVEIRIKNDVVQAEWRNGDVFEMPFSLFEATPTERRKYWLKEAKDLKDQQDREIAEIKAKERAAKEKREIEEYNRLREKFEGRDGLATRHPGLGNREEMLNLEG